MHAETGIDRAGASVVSVALGEAERVLGPLAGRRALVIGAGSMGALAAATLLRAGVAELTVANRTPDRAERLAAQLRRRGRAPAGPGRRAGRRSPTSWSARTWWSAAPARSAPCVPAELVETAVAGRAGRPLVLLDLALPRDVDGAVAALPGVHYVDLAALQAPAARIGAQADVERARRIVAEEVRRPARRPARHRGHADRRRAAGPGRRGGRRRADPARRAGCPAWTTPPGPRSRAACTGSSQTLLHAPTVRVKQLAERPGGDAYADALRELFDLDPAATAAVVVGLDCPAGPGGPA